MSFLRNGFLFFTSFALLFSASLSFASTSLCRQSLIEPHHELPKSSRLDQLETRIASGSLEDWHDGLFGSLHSQSQNFSLLEKLSVLEKESLLEALRKNPNFQKAPVSYQRLFKMGLNDFESWKSWIEYIHDYGMNRGTPEVFQKTIQQMPASLRRQIVGEISAFYASKYRAKPFKVLHDYSFDVAETHILTREQKQEIRQEWEHPKRIYDRLIPWLTQGPTMLRNNIKAGMPGLQAYEIYLNQLRTWMRGTMPAYTAEDILHASLSMQSKLQELVKDPQYVEQTKIFKKNKDAFIVLYGSYPNGRADFKAGSDIDVAVSYPKLAKGEHDKDRAVLSFDGPSHLSTWDMENAAIEVLKKRLGIEQVYDPTSHNTITADQIFARNLAYLSPLRIKISLDRIELLVDDVDSSGNIWSRLGFRPSSVAVELKN